MVLVDTSVWISHFRQADKRLQTLLMEGKIVCHPFIIGEMACGRLNNRKEILGLMEALPKSVQASHEEVLYFIEEKQLMGCGLGYVDVHILASTVLTGSRLWTLDQGLQDAFDHSV
jgi:predicted nucleic acid-binding protein